MPVFDVNIAEDTFNERCYSSCCDCGDPDCSDQTPIEGVHFNEITNHSMVQDLIILDLDKKDIPYSTSFIEAYNSVVKDINLSIVYLQDHSDLYDGRSYTAWNRVKDLPAEEAIKNWRVGRKTFDSFMRTVRDRLDECLQVQYAGYTRNQASPFISLCHHINDVEYYYREHVKDCKALANDNSLYEFVVSPFGSDCLFLGTNDFDETCYRIGGEYGMAPIALAVNRNILTFWVRRKGTLNDIVARGWGYYDGQTFAHFNAYSSRGFESLYDVGMILFANSIGYKDISTQILDEGRASFRYSRPWYYVNGNGLRRHGWYVKDPDKPAKVVLMQPPDGVLSSEGDTDLCCGCGIQEWTDELHETNNGEVCHTCLKELGYIRLDYENTYAKEEDIVMTSRGPVTKDFIDRNDLFVPAEDSDEYAFYHRADVYPHDGKYFTTVQARENYIETLERVKEEV